MMNTDNIIVCDICGGEFHVSKDCLVEEEIVLSKPGLDPHGANLTVLRCPCCGKSYPVILDDETTLPILDKLRALTLKKLKQIQKGFKPKPELEEKCRILNNKLDFKRQKLALKYNGSFYQLEDGTMVQLDYRYHTR